MMELKQSVRKNTVRSKADAFRKRTIDREIRERRTIGFGAKPDTDKIKAASAGLGADPKRAAGLGFGDWISAVRNSVQCTTWNMPVIESSRGDIGGPLPDASVSRLFGAKINPFGWNDTTTELDGLDTTLAQNGETQTPMLVCAIGWKLQPEPLCWTASGNAWDGALDTVATQPISPNAFALADLPEILGQTEVTNNFEPAVLEWGWPMNYAAWHMVRGYHLRWMIGQHTNLFDESLRNTAYTPPNAQEGSASSSEVDVDEFVARTNTRYLSPLLGTSMIFLKQNALRLGVQVGGAGFFTPSRAGEFVGATYGGIDLRSMIGGNSEFRKLAIPYFLNAGIPFGLYAQESDAFEADLMRAYLSVTQTPGDGTNVVTPPLILDSGLINPAQTGTFTELTNTGVAITTQRMFPGRRLFKGGELKIEVDLKGFEVDEDWVKQLDQNPELREAVMCECGCAWAKRS